jgi:protease-4
MQNDMLDSLWNRWVTAVAQARKLSKDEIKAIVDNGPYTAGDLAKDTKLVDAVGGPEKVAQLVASEMGAIYPVSVPPAERPDRWTRPAVAVIYVDGDIVDGKSRSIPLLGQKLVGSETLVAAISAARANPKIGAIILRIDTPGGSALASELISREVFATRGTKPILCSCDVAASGGYFPPPAATRSAGHDDHRLIGIFYGVRPSGCATVASARRPREARRARRHGEHVPAVHRRRADDHPRQAEGQAAASSARSRRAAA